jgi:hypothetical protein
VRCAAAAAAERGIVRGFFPEEKVRFPTRLGERGEDTMGTKKLNVCRMGAIALAAAAALAARGFAGQISTMEGDVDPMHTTPGQGEPAAYTWGDSFDSNQVDHLPSILGITDGSGSMFVRKPGGNFSWGLQYLFNDPLNQPRYTDLVGAGTVDEQGGFHSTNPSATKFLLDISTPPNPNIVYSVGFSAVNYGFVQGGFPGYFIDSYNPSGGGNYQQFTAGPASQTELRHETYVWDLGGEFRGNGVPLWDHIGAYMIYHVNVNSGTAVEDSISYYDHFRVINEDDQVRATWNGPANGSANWTDAGSWQHGVPNAVGAPAIFYGNNPNTANDGTTVLAAVTFTANVNSAVTVGSIIFDSTETKYTSNGSPATNHGDVNYILSGSGALTLDVASGLSEIYVISGNNQINVPVTVNDNLDIDLAAGFGPDSGAPAGGRWSSMPTTSLTFGSPVTIAAGSNVTTRGAGTTEFNGGVSGGGLIINGGTTNFGGNANVSQLLLRPAAYVNVGANGNRVIRTGTLELASVSQGSITVAATMDLNDNDLISTATGYSAIAGKIAAARDGGAWDRPGLTSSAARTQTNHATTLGVLTGSEYAAAHGGTFDGFAVAPTDTLVKYTWYGDTDFNGKVNFDDYVRTDNGFNNHLSGWVNGDFDLNGAVNFDDYVLIDLAFNTQSGTLGRALSFIDGSNPSLSGMNDPALQKVVQHLDEFGSNYGQHLLSAVPEPASVLLAGVISSLTVLSRRRRRVSTPSETWL